MNASNHGAIETFSLSKHFGSAAALTELSFTVPTGAIYGVLGPNGAGKTTLIRLLMGFVRPSGGTATIFGRDCWRDGVAARRDVGYLVTADALYPDLSGRAQLDFAASLSGTPPVLRERVLDALEFPQALLGKRLGTYSKGTRQKLALTAAIQTDPALLVLDEPSDGLDPLVQRAFEEVLTDLRDRGRTVFLSSHDLAEVERVCERVAIVRQGRLVTEAAVADLRRQQRRVATVAFADGVPDGLGRVPGIEVHSVDGSRAELLVDGEIGPLLAFLGSAQVDDLLIRRPRLEEIFLRFYDGASAAETSPEPAAERRR